MKTWYWTRLAAGVALVGVLLIASSTEAKKPVKPPPGPSQSPCDNAETFAPDITFWRSVGGHKNTRAAIYLAESDTGCEQLLTEFSIPNFHLIDELKYSTFDVVGDPSGRVVWIALTSDSGTNAWMQDFHVVAATVVPDGAPIMLLQGDPSDAHRDLINLDLSPDGRTLVFTRYGDDPDPDYYFQELRVLDIGTCLSGAACSVSDGSVLGSVSGLRSEANGDFFYPSWDPWGDRIYVTRMFLNSDFYSAVQAYDFVGIWVDSGLLFSDEGLLMRPVSGIGPDGREYLAIAKEVDTACEYIWLVDVESCEDQGICLQGPEFAGYYPSWTQDGRLIHAYDGWEAHGGCGLSEVGVWDGSSGSLEAIFTGQQPNAAAGVIE